MNNFRYTLRWRGSHLMLIILSPWILRQRRWSGNIHKLTFHADFHPIEYISRINGRLFSFKYLNKKMFDASHYKVPCKIFHATREWEFFLSTFQLIKSCKHILHARAREINKIKQCNNNKEEEGGGGGEKSEECQVAYFVIRAFKRNERNRLPLPLPPTPSAKTLFFYEASFTTNFRVTWCAPPPPPFPPARSS